MSSPEPQVHMSMPLLRKGRCPSVHIHILGDLLRTSDARPGIQG